MISDLDRVWAVTESPSLKRQCIDNILVSDTDVQKNQTLHNDAIAISMIIAKYDIKEY